MDFGPNVDDDTFIQAGWLLIHRTGQPPRPPRARDLDDFTTYFGTFPAICVELWIRIWSIEPLVGARPKHLLWSLYFLRHYDRMDRAKLTIGANKEPVRKWSWAFIEKISSLSLDLIDWDRRYEGETPTPNHYAYVDGTTCPTTEERKPFSKDWSAHKLGKKPGLNYELATCIATGFIVWTNGPFPAGSFQDKTIFDRDLILAIGEGERVYGDTGYSGREEYVTVTDRTETDPVLKRIKARHEQVNGWMKAWLVLSERFRHSKEQHYDCYHAVAVITQIEMETGYKMNFEIVRYI